MKHFTIGRVSLALLATGVLFLSLAPVASAGGGNSASVKLCQKGGWANPNLYNASTALPLHFTNQGACVSYGARGGAYSSLVVTPGPFFGFPGFTVSGFDLEPNSLGSFTDSSGGFVISSGTLHVDSNGTTSGGGGEDCSVYGVSSLTGTATATTSRGATLSVSATEPC